MEQAFPRCLPELAAGFGGAATSAKGKGSETGENGGHRGLGFILSIVPLTISEHLSLPGYPYPAETDSDARDRSRHSLKSSFFCP